MLEDSTLSDNTYAYNPQGELTEATETPAGEGCTTQIYAYDTEGDRTGLTTRPPGEGGACATSGGTSEGHTYDEAGRLTDPGVAYGSLGNITALPGDDAGGHEIQTSYYADGQAQMQSQDGVENTYTLDPEGRTETTQTRVELASTAAVTAHYARPGSSDPSWTYDESSGTFSRMIAAFGSLAAAEESGKQAVLQLSDLQGAIVLTASDSESAGTPSSSERQTVSGVPVNEKSTSEYNWLDAGDLTPSLPSGAVVQDGSTFVPQTGAALQLENAPVPAVDNVSAETVLNIPPPSITKYEEAAAPPQEASAPPGETAQPEAKTPIGGSVAWECEYTIETHQPIPEACEGGSTVVVVGGTTAVAANISFSFRCEGLWGFKTCLVRGKHPKKRDDVRIHKKNGNWWDVANTFCGIVGGAFLVPGVDIFGTPAEVACAGYGLATAAEAIVKSI